MAKVDSNNIVERALKLCESKWKYSAEIKLHLDEELPLLDGLEVELSQVVLNLINNAVDAIKEKSTDIGVILISTRVDGNEVVLGISDNGRVLDQI